MKETLQKFAGNPMHEHTLWSWGGLLLDSNTFLFRIYLKILFPIEVDAHRRMMQCEAGITIKWKRTSIFISLLKVISN
jgi:hypothetical protein